MKSIHTIWAIILLLFIQVKLTAQLPQYGNGSQRLTGMRTNTWSSNTLAWKPSDSTLLQYNNEGYEAFSNLKLYNGQSSTWSNYKNIYSQYDANGWVTQKVDSFFVLNQFDIPTKTTYQYDTAGRETLRNVARWKASISGFEVFERFQTSYTASGKTNAMLHQRYKPSNSTYSNFMREVYTYNGLNQATQKLYESYDTLSGQWKSVTRETYTYNAAGRIQMISYSNYANNVWKDSLKFEYTYNINGNILTETKAEWLSNQSPQTWRTVQSDVYTTLPTTACSHTYDRFIMHKATAW